MGNPASNYERWLSENNVSRPHKSGRWRVFASDSCCISFQHPEHPHYLEVGGFFSEAPSASDIEFFNTWRDSDEKRHKQNAAGFLRFAKYRNLVDGTGETQRERVKKMCAQIRSAMTSFQNGDNAAGELAMKDAWGNYMILLMLSCNSLIVKGSRFSSGRQKGAVGEFRALVEQAFNAGARSFKEVVSHMEECSSRIDEVDWEREEIWLDGAPTSKKFKTVKNILADLKAKIP